MVNTKGPSKKKKGRSKRAHVLVAAVEAATANFIERGEEIAYENPDIRGEMLGAVEEVRKTGTCGEGDEACVCVLGFPLLKKSRNEIIVGFCGC